MSTPSIPPSVGNVERWLCGLTSFSSRGTYIVKCGDSRSDGQYEQGSCGNRSLSRSDSLNRSLSRSDSLNRSLSRSSSLHDWMCPPLPGQVPVEPVKPSNVPTAQGATTASPVNKSSTGKPRKRKKMERIGSFLRRVWKAMKSPFSGCCDSSAVDVVEPFVPPADSDSDSDPDPDPSPPDPDHSGVTPNIDAFESLYNVGEMIGSGGYGRVFKGTRKFDDKKVAIKRMRKTCNDVYLDIPGHPKPLITEVALLLTMRQEPISPFAIQLYDWFEHPRKFTLILEFPEPCESLLDFIIRNPQLEETTARVIMRQAVLAVQHCIEHGVFHNDIHAHNFLLNKDTSELKLIDFGCGQLLSSDGYESDVYVGLLGYCPPEVFTQPRFHAVPANVWSLGVLLYEMVNACPPFGDAKEITQAKVTFQRSNLSKECCDLISQCLTLDPTERLTLEQMLQHEWLRNDLL